MDGVGLRSFQGATAGDRKLHRWNIIGKEAKQQRGAGRPKKFDEFCGGLPPEEQLEGEASASGDVVVGMGGQRTVMRRWNGEFRDGGGTVVRGVSTRLPLHGPRGETPMGATSGSCGK